MGSYKEEPVLWTSGRTTSSFLGAPAKKDTDTLSSNNSGITPRKESYRNVVDPNRLSTITAKTKSIDLNLSASPPSYSRWSEDRRPSGSTSERGIRSREPSQGSSILKTNSVNTIATSNYNYPVVNVNRSQSDDPSTRSSLPPPPPPPTITETANGSDDKAQKRENLRKQRDTLNWDLQSLVDSNPTTTTTSTTATLFERKESVTNVKSPSASKGADIEGLMTKVWDKQYKEAELYVAGKFLLLSLCNHIHLTILPSHWNGIK